MSGVDWEGMQPPTGPTPAPPEGALPPPPPAHAPAPAAHQPVTAPVPPYAPPPPAAAPPSWPPVPPPAAPTSYGPTPPKRGRVVALSALVALLLIAGGFAFARATESHKSTPSASSSQSADTTPVTSGKSKVDPGTAQEEPIAAVAAAVSPSVVQIETDTGLGSGVIYSDQGYILTAAHVVSDAGKTVRVRLADGTVKQGDVIGSDDASDIAVVKIDPGSGLDVASLALGVKVEVGQTAVAIGSPFGLEETVTAGIVSAVNRPQETPGGAIDMIQIDAPINPGNSGGPVADRQGRVFGIADSIISQSGTNAGVGFLIPIDLAKAVADKLVAGEPVEFAFLGVSTDTTSSSLVGDGAVVVDVTSGSPADKAGIQQGDKILSVDSSPVRDPVELGARVRSHKPGDVVAVVFERNGTQQTVQVTLGSTKSK